MKTSLYDTMTKTHADNALIIEEAHAALDRLGVTRKINDRELTLAERINTIAKDS